MQLLMMFAPLYNFKGMHVQDTSCTQSVGHMYLTAVHLCWICIYSQITQLNTLSEPQTGAQAAYRHAARACVALTCLAIAVKCFSKGVQRQQLEVPLLTMILSVKLLGFII